MGTWCLLCIILCIFIFLKITKYVKYANDGVVPGWPEDKWKSGENYHHPGSLCLSCQPAAPAPPWVLSLHSIPVCERLCPLSPRGLHTTPALTTSGQTPMGHAPWALREKGDVIRMTSAIYQSWEQHCVTGGACPPGPNRLVRLLPGSAPLRLWPWGWLPLWVPVSTSVKKGLKAKLPWGLEMANAEPLVQSSPEGEWTSRETIFKPRHLRSSCVLEKSMTVKVHWHRSSGTG